MKAALELAKRMKDLGVRRFVYVTADSRVEIELDPLEPFARAQKADVLADAITKQKDDKLCAMCQKNPRGFTLAPMLCRECGLSQGGVTGVTGIG
jgi:hypothetical protein